MTSGPRNNWDERYDHERFFYGQEPNYYVERQLAGIAPGRGLFLAEGEGRNAVFAAGLGHEILAVDSSAVGRSKALELATAREVTIDYRSADLLTDPWDREDWDFIVLCFVHLPPDIMPDVHRRVAAALRPGGTMILNSFAKAQLGRKSGGPPRLEWLHDLAELRTQFPGLDLKGRETEVDLDESVGHSGSAMVIELTGHKVVVPNP